MVKAAPDIQELTWHSQLSLGVLLLNTNNFIENHHQTRAFYNHRQKQDHAVFVFYHRQNHEHGPIYKISLF